MCVATSKEHKPLLACKRNVGFGLVDEFHCSRNWCFAVRKIRLVSCLNNNIVCRTSKHHKTVDLTFMTAVGQYFCKPKEKFVSWHWLKMLSLKHMHSGNCKAYCNEFDMNSAITFTHTNSRTSTTTAITATKRTLFYQPTNNNRVAATHKNCTKTLLPETGRHQRGNWSNENETAISDVFNFQSKVWFDQHFKHFDLFIAFPC